MRRLFVESLNKVFKNKEHFPNRQFEKIESKNCRTWRVKCNKHYVEFHAYSDTPEKLIITCDNVYHKMHTSTIDCRFYHNKKSINETIIGLIWSLD